jgi:hypothetical protein
LSMIVGMRSCAVSVIGGTSGSSIAAPARKRVRTLCQGSGSRSGTCPPYRRDCEGPRRLDPEGRAAESCVVSRGMYARSMLARRLLASLVCAAALADAAGCGGTSQTSASTTIEEASTAGAETNVDTLRTAASIEQTLLAKRGIKAKVACPAVVPAVPGAKFECIASFRASQPPHALTRAPFLVTIHNSSGDVTFEGK